MELKFPFKNIAVNYLLPFAEDRDYIADFIHSKKGDKPLINIFEYQRSDFLDTEATHFREQLPDFENELLQIINTTNQFTIDAYFKELFNDFSLVKESFSIERLKSEVNRWNNETLEKYNLRIEAEVFEYSKNKDRKRKHLEEYEDTVVQYRMPYSVSNPYTPKTHKIKKTNYNFYCIQDSPDLIDLSYIEEYHTFILEFAKEFSSIAIKYGIPYSKGEIISKVDRTLFSKPVVFVEGEHDITYLKKAAELLGLMAILEKVDIRQRGGSSKLDAMWNVFKENNWETIPQKKLLLYDCDVKQVNEEVGTIYKRIIPAIEGNIVTKGIENLFPNELINRILIEKVAFIDITILIQTKRGNKTRSITYSVNPDEKKNMCDWVCANGGAENFINFKVVFTMIEGLLLTD